MRIFQRTATACGGHVVQTVTIFDSGPSASEIDEAATEFDAILETGRRQRRIVAFAGIALLAIGCGTFFAALSW